MIYKTLPHTKKCTFIVIVPHPDPKFKDFPTPNGTGFFISSDGYFITAHHVVKHAIEEKKENKISLINPDPDSGDVGVGGIEVKKIWPKFDLALLRADFSNNKHQEFLKDKDSFDFLEIEFSIPKEGIPIYSFGYPLPDIEVLDNQHFMVGFHSYYPRVTSLIISSHYDVIASMRIKRTFPEYYVVDKALNYGNSGGPIILQESGKVISVCIKFQPVDIPQSNDIKITIPSLYGITSSLKNIESELKEIIKIN